MKGVYEVTPNLRPFGTDFGNGDQDQVLFQFDSEYPKYRASKLASFSESPSKYIARSEFSERVESAVLHFIRNRLVQEGSATYHGESLHLTVTGETIPDPLDELLLALQEDLAVVTKVGDRDWLSYVNVCNPSHWLPTEKIGLSFFQAHVPVPGFERINAAAGALVDSMIRRGPFVRFVWGLESDDQLNHHPIAPKGIDQTEWYGRQFERAIFVRVERQVLWPLPEVDSSLFTIRPYVYPISQFQGDSLKALIAAYHSMDPNSRAYKGLPPEMFSR